MEKPHSTSKEAQSLRDECVATVEEMNEKGEKEDHWEDERNRQDTLNPADADYPINPIQALTKAHHTDNDSVACFVFPTPWLEKPPPRPQPFVDALKATTFGRQLARWTDRCLDALDLWMVNLASGGDADFKILWDVLRDARTRRGPSNRVGLLVHKLVSASASALASSPPQSQSQSPTSTSASPPSLSFVYTARIHACRHPDRIYGRLAEFLMADDTWQPAVGHLQNPKFCWPAGPPKGNSLQQATATLTTVAAYVARNVGREVACLGATDECFLRGNPRPSALAFDPRQRWRDDTEEEAQMDLLRDMVWAQVADEVGQQMNKHAEQQVREALRELDIEAATETGSLTISLDADLHAVCNHPGHRVGGTAHKDHDGVRVVTVDSAATTDISGMISRREQVTKNMQNREQEQKNEKKREQKKEPVDSDRPSVTLHDETVDGIDYKIVRWSWKTHLPTD